MTDQTIVYFLLLLEEPWYTKGYANVHQINFDRSQYQLGRRSWKVSTNAPEATGSGNLT